jgi:hypothetical protein
MTLTIRRDGAGLTLEARLKPEVRAALETDPGPDDPRLVALAERLARWLAARPGGCEGEAPSVQAATVAHLVAASAGASSPAWRRLAEFAGQRRGRG